ncbi:MAG: hypothetical protein JWO38_7169 [Gemmataceae bacterium]|nr:hypothetical protein [Gemmataceae bacterium]
MKGTRHEIVTGRPGPSEDDPVVRQFLADREADLAELQVEFAAAEVADTFGLRRWFDDHPYLTYHEHALAAGVSETTIGRWKRRAGRTRAVPHIPRPVQVPRLPWIEVPPDWRSREWLEVQVARHGVRRVAAAVGRSRACVRKVVARLGLAPYRVRPLHPRHDREWLWERYVRRGWSQGRCARAAGVSRQTIHRWLAGFDIFIRTFTFPAPRQS